MNIKIASIEQDVSIQCRAVIDTAVVNDYAERMTEGDKFPPIEVYGTKDQCWIGDGWHRVMAAKQIGAVDIPATLHAGGRADALKHALGANAVHGHRRTNADKRRCVEIALKEFPKLSNVQIGKLCGVDDKTVAAHRTGRVGNSEPEKRTGADGKEYPATRTAPNGMNFEEAEKNFYKCVTEFDEYCPKIAAMNFKFRIDAVGNEPTAANIMALKTIRDECLKLGQKVSGGLLSIEAAFGGMMIASGITYDELKRYMRDKARKAKVTP